MEVDEASWLTLEPAPGETLRAALERTLRDAIRAGALREGVRLPSSRALAQAARRLARRRQRRVRPARGAGLPRRARARGAGRRRRAPRRDAVRPRAGAAARAPRYDLTPTTPDVTLFPLARWLAAAQQAARRAPTATLDYGDPRGERALREALADHLGRTRGVIAEPEQIVVVQGTAQGVEVVLRVLAARGARASRSRTRRTRRSTSASARTGSRSSRSRSTSTG